jgi:uncharacterized protein (TIGR02246 family)
MRKRSILTLGSLAAIIAACWLTAPAAYTQQPDADTAAIRAAGEQFVKAFNAGKVDELVAMFLPKAELVDEDGTTHEGQAAIKDLLTKFFAKFPGAKLTVDVDSLRVIGPVALEEGTRVITTKDDSGQAQMHFSMVRTKVGNNWPIVSLRDYTDDSDLTPHDRLQTLGWLVGEWVNEGNDAAVRITYRWSNDKNFLLGEFHVTKGGSPVMNSSQRIGWDPLAGKVRSWMFDSDGGYGDGHWTELDDGSWVIKSLAVLPDGQTGSATVTVIPQGKDRYVLKGTDRIAGDSRDDDFEFVVTRRPPMPSK